MTVGEFLSLLTLVILAGITWWYARATKQIADATGQQADASVRMAVEMRETAEAARTQAEASVRMAEEMQKSRRPRLDLECIISQSSIDLILSALGTDAVLVRDLDIKVINVGFGPAFDVHVYIEPSDLGFPSKDIARVDSGLDAIKELKLIAEEGVGLNLTKLGFETCLIATYTDLEGRRWRSLRKMGKNYWWEYGPLEVVETSDKVTDFSSRIPRA